MLRTGNIRHNCSEPGKPMRFQATSARDKPTNRDLSTGNLIQFPVRLAPCLRFQRAELRETTGGVRRRKIMKNRIASATPRSAPSSI
jgi:hypothetical protein